MWRLNAARMRAECSAPPPSEKTPPSARSSISPTSSASIARNASSPCSAKQRSIGMPMCSAIDGVGVGDLEPERSREAARGRRLAGAHEADEHERAAGRGPQRALLAQRRRHPIRSS